MDPTIIKFARNHPDAVMPVFAHPGDSGFDLHTVEDTDVPPNGRVILRTGLRAELPPGYEIQIRPRSGISAKTRLTVIVGTIDSGYRGEMGVIVHNTHVNTCTIKKGYRIGQAVVQHVPAIKIVEVSEEDLSNTSRGEGGFGSTGTNYKPE